MISTIYKSELVNKTKNLITKARVNDSIEVLSLNSSVSADALTIEFILPESIIINKVEFLDSANNVITTIPGLNIDSSITTAFSHNIQFIQGGA